MANLILKGKSFGQGYCKVDGPSQKSEGVL